MKRKILSPWTNECFSWVM